MNRKRAAPAKRLSARPRRQNAAAIGFNLPASDWQSAMRDKRSLYRSERAAINCLAYLVIFACSTQVGHAQSGHSPSPPANRVGGGLPRAIPLNLRQFEIPFSIDSVGKPPVEVQLYVSTNEGEQWELFATQPATGKNFLFTAQRDGVFWFATKTIDHQGESIPSKPVQPQLIVNVDTENPVVELKAVTKGDGSIQVTLVCTDRSPSIDTLRLDYSIDQSRQWNTINDVSGQSDPNQPGCFSASADFAPDANWTQVAIRALVGDSAGNKTIVTTIVDKPRVAANDFRLATNKSPQSDDATMTAPLAANSPQTADDTLRVAQAPSASPPPSYGAPPGYATQPHSPPPQGFAPQGYPPQGVMPPQGYPSQPAYATQPGYAMAPPYAMPPGSAGIPNMYAPPGYPNVYPGAAYPQSLPSAGGAAPLQSTNPASTPNPSTSAAWAVPQFAISSGTAPAIPPTASGQIAPLVGPELTAPLTSAEFALPEGGTPSAAAPTPRPKTAAGAMRPIGDADAIASAPQTSNTQFSPNDGDSSGSNSGNDLTQSRHSSMPPASTFDQSVAEPVGNGLAGTGVQIRYSNSRKFSLEYEIESAGLSGVNDVELWGTRDRGLTWKRWGSDPDRESPFDIETINDGAYGFRIVVVAANGLATPRPIENDLPDIFVVVDSEAPSIRITGAAYGEGNQTGSLVIRYQCTDLNLPQRPITLSFGPSISGPWSTIAAGLENEGAYLWPADPNLPRQIYLRIDALDLAGNMGTYILDTPIDVQGLAPRARIRGFNPVTGSAGGTKPNVPERPETNQPGRPQTAKQPQARFK